MSQRPRVLLVAIGGYGRYYFNEMVSHDTGADLAGVVEVMPDIYEKIPLLRQKNIPVYASLEDFYARDHADLAVIIAPIHLHTSMSLYCMRHGTHVLCEKPLCTSAEELHALEACSRETGRFLAVGYQRNYQKDMLALKADILSGKFGAPRRVRVVDAVRRGAHYYARNNWAGHIRVNGCDVFDSPFNNACAHNFQLMTFLLGQKAHAACTVTGLDAELYRGNPTVENYDIAALRFQTDAGAPIYYYTAHPLRSVALGPYARLEFEHALVTCDEREHYTARLQDGSVIDYGLLGPTPGMQKLYDALDCVRHGGAPVCGIDAAGAHLHAVLLTQRQPVKDIPAAHVDVFTENDDTYWAVRSLEDVFLQSAQAWALPQEAGLSL